MENNNENVHSLGYVCGGGGSSKGGGVEAVTPYKYYN